MEGVEGRLVSDYGGSGSSLQGMSRVLNYWVANETQLYNIIMQFVWRQVTCIHFLYRGDVDVAVTVKPTCVLPDLWLVIMD